MSQPTVVWSRHPETFGIFQAIKNVKFRTSALVQETKKSNKCLQAEL